MDNEKERQIFAACLVAEFSDGTRQRFYADTENEALDKIAKATEEHGDIAWYDGVTDEKYIQGTYHKLVKDEAPHIQGIEITDASAAPEEIKQLMQMIFTPNSKTRPS